MKTVLRCVCVTTRHNNNNNNNINNNDNVYFVFIMRTYHISTYTQMALKAQLQLTYKHIAWV